MRLAWHHARAYLATAALIALGLAALVAALTLVENAGELAREAVAGDTGARLVLAAAAEHAYALLPVAALLALLVTGTRLARQGELVAVAAAGHGPARTYAPFVLATVALAALAWLVGERVLPLAIAERARLQRDVIGHPDPLTEFYGRRAEWYRDGELLLHLPAVDLQAQAFLQPTLYRVVAGRIAALTQARVLRFVAGGWQLEDARTYRVDAAAVEHAARLPVALRAGPRDLADVAGSPREMRLRDIAALIARRSQAGLDVRAHRLAWHARLALPCAVLLLVALGLPWALDVGRRRALAVTLGVGALGIAIWLSTSQLLQLLALARVVPVALGAWGAHALALAGVPLSFWLHAGGAKLQPTPSAMRASRSAQRLE